MRGLFRKREKSNQHGGVSVAERTIELTQGVFDDGPQGIAINPTSAEDINRLLEPLGLRWDQEDGKLHVLPGCQLQFRRQETWQVTVGATTEDWPCFQVLLPIALIEGPKLLIDHHFLEALIGILKEANA